jgi:hypothetical protein
MQQPNNDGTDKSADQHQGQYLHGHQAAHVGHRLRRRFCAGCSVTRTAFRYPRTLLLNKEFAPAL